jgi:hypothetical protein
MAKGNKNRFPAEVRARLGQVEYKRRLAFQKLGISPGDVQSVPFVRSSLKRIARILDQDPLDLLAACDHPDARAVHNVYCRVPKSYKRFVSLEDVCTAAKVPPWRVFELVASVAARERALGAAVVAAIWGPRLVQKSVERALQADGVEDRKMIHIAVGFLPSRG